jgi:hypothetical protein
MDRVTRRADGSAVRVAAALAVALSAWSAPARAQDWHEAYRAGVSAMARGDHAGAVTALRRAIALRPEPGRNVVTYGTNLEPRYFPYLRLAESHLALGELDPARDALRRSASWGDREPAEEREKLLARLESLVTPKPAPPAPSPTASPPVTTQAPAPVETPVPSPTAAPTTPEPRSAAPPPTTLPPQRAPGRASESRAVPGAIEVVSQPPGAVVYIDDEPVGSTDPGSGRLVKAGMRPGLHRVRVARDGHADAVREIDLGSGATAVFHATLAPVPKETPAQAPVPTQALPLGAGTVAFALVAFALVGVLVWIALRRGPDASTPVATPTRGGVPSPATPSGQINPGAQRDALGQEWFGEFRLLEMLGRGGMASVYKAERHGELAALKRPLLTLLDDPEFLERFLREADIGRTLNHPNIVRILERGRVERVPYFTMELLAGGTLQGLARSGAGEPRSAAAIVVQVAEALDFAHSKGVVHRDLKPSNVMLLRDGTVKVMDFGIAQARRFEGITATGAFLGTPDYVAPEMIEGRGAEARSDLYALGVILFELLTGRQPFSAETGFALLKKHCTEDPPTPSQLRRGLPPELDAVVLRLLRKDPRDRPSAEELVVTLRDWLNRAA